MVKIQSQINRVKALLRKQISKRKTKYLDKPVLSLGNLRDFFVIVTVIITITITIIIVNR